MKNSDLFAVFGNIWTAAACCANPPMVGYCMAVAAACVVLMVLCMRAEKTKERHEA